MAIDFIQSNGLDYIIQVPKGSRAAAAVSVCLYYLAFNNDAMERLNQYPEYKLDRVVDYTLDLIETKPGFTPRTENVKGSPDQSHFIFEINVGESRIRHRTTLNLNDVIFNRF